MKDRVIMNITMQFFSVALIFNLISTVFASKFLVQSIVLGKNKIGVNLLTPRSGLKYITTRSFIATKTTSSGEVDYIQKLPKLFEKNAKYDYFCGIITSEMLNDPKFFDAAVKEGNRYLCMYLVQSGQKVQLIDDAGNNLLSRLIEKDFPEILGVIFSNHTAEALKARDFIDTKTKMTPFYLAVESSNLSAVYEMVATRSVPDRLSASAVSDHRFWNNDSVSKQK